MEYGLILGKRLKKLYYKKHKIRGGLIIKNKYKIVGNYFILYLEKKDGSVYETKISIEDFDRINEFKYKWCHIYQPNNKQYYAQATVYLGSVNGKAQNTTVGLHTFLMEDTEGLVVDHVNHDGLDNRRENLRLVKNEENTKYHKGKNINNTSGYRNVSHNSIGTKWIVQMQVDGKNKVLKSFPLDKLDEAGAYAKIKRQELYGEFAGNS